MSPLSKVFVVLLVVCSMLTTAATVVFVNKVEVTDQSLQTARTAADAAKKAADAAVAAANAQAASAANALTVAQGQVAALHASLDDANKTVASNTVDMASKDNNAALQLANITRMSQALAAAQADNGKLSDMVTDLRTTNDKLVKNDADLNLAIADKTNLYETANRELEFAREQLQEVQNKVAKQTALLEANHISDSQVAALPDGTTATPAINGVVKDIKDIGGVTYVTISVGSADSVQKGMEFNVVDRTQGKFLGVVTVDYVDTNEATGRLTGPADTLMMVHPGVEVRTNFE